MKKTYLLIPVALLLIGAGCASQTIDTQTGQEEAPAVDGETLAILPADPDANVYPYEDGILPLGDGKISTGPQRNSVFSCQTRFGGGGAFRDGSWIKDNTWVPAEKVTIDGSVDWPNARIDITVSGDTRIISANNLPTHPTGVFPVDKNDDAYQYDRNPNRIEQQDILLRLPANPTFGSEPTCVPMGMIGFSTTGVAIFNALDALGRDAPAHEIQDTCNGHPERNGQYHYHDWSDCITDNAGKQGTHSDLAGYALDGFGIYGLYGEDGQKHVNDDLDACHGHIHTVTWDGSEKKIYHYHMTEEYPYTIGCFRGDIQR